MTRMRKNKRNGFSSLRTLRKEITEADWKLCLTEASSHPSTSLAATIATHTTWPKLWDMALDHGPRGTVSLQAIYRTLTRPTFGQTPCPHCDIQQVEQSYFEHFISNHTPISNPDFFVNLLVTHTPNISSVPLHPKLRLQLFHCITFITFTSVICCISFHLYVCHVILPSSSFCHVHLVCVCTMPSWRLMNY